LAVVSAPIYGRPRWSGRLLPVGRDSLSEALSECAPRWTLDRLTRAAAAAARELDDFSLVGLAALVHDAVVLTAVRESVTLYAEQLVLGEPPRREIVWRVDGDLAEQAGRFIDAFNGLFQGELPPAAVGHGEDYWEAYEGTTIAGRCVRLGRDSGPPVRYYH